MDWASARGLRRRHRGRQGASADDLLLAADRGPRLVSHDTGLPFHFHYVSVQAGLAARVKALTAAGLAHVIDDGAGPRLRGL